MLLSSSSLIGTERIASCGVSGRSGVLSGGEMMDGEEVGDLGGVEGCTNSVKPVEDMIWEELWMNREV